MDLGIPDTDLVPTTHGSGGAGGTWFPTWTSTRTLTAQVAPTISGDLQLWGPTFELAPVFAENTTPLFGRADFFKAFVITFAQDANLGEVFHLDY
jgi:hypothetical protein